ncbi:MAG: hypothetical protein A3I89_02145 [Candidatus Harrisonbacteria bacterium RIFCSPLOWO2_02_FULL_41_11]|uniref:Methyltransferase domain-containing protein n=1 Tax=Candidatus Harrisonbacteria bacterium RIFCSPHIGHO2_02_FULL_42_16 TaxID=1798404 RepID=A0A1G1ZG92_9BACT|nr:MAG: hypothetical protein A3B92_01625 [Candidatus Harrisonbacteria bacterium RIFCSPHIGHO2_02_FULL_42_16]OGY65659.1 MAG: hypothetical protein A3I89_02145 [Candidatus Harrisonbacteria bacterium RIFCSPLOWO2_02_FULL_41_11]
MTEPGWENVEQKIEGIDGWLSDIENHFLYSTAKNCANKGVIVEIGSWKGRSTICLALGSKEGKQVKVYAIDPHTGSPDHQRPGQKIWTFNEFTNNIRAAGAASLVIPVISTAEDAVKNWNLPIEFIFIDANYHDHELTKNLIINWSKHLIRGGTIALNSTNPSMLGILSGKPLHGLPGPKKAVADLIYGSRNFKNIRLAGCITYAQKCDNNTLSERMAGRFTQLKSGFLYSIHGAYLLLTKIPSPIKKFLKKSLASRTNLKS